jgi:hypothetical protein
LEDKISYEDDKNHWLRRRQGWYLDTNRDNHDHGVPLDVYDLVTSMLERARHYYDIGKFIRAAIISSDVLDLLNGFHEALMLKAYHLLAVSENAIAMNAIGGDEKLLREDAVIRINKIKCEIARMMDREDEGKRESIIGNVLNQIYSDCRNYCKEKEHFEAEEAFISAMGHSNDGINICVKIKSMFNSLFKQR